MSLASPHQLLMPQVPHAMTVIFAVALLATTVVRAAPADLPASRFHPWRPPFGLARVGPDDGAMGFNADASLSAEPTVNPIDLGTILVPSNWLVVGPQQVVFIDVAAISHGRNELNARVRAWFSSEPNKVVSTPFPLPVGERIQQRFKLPLAPSKLDQNDVHVTIERANGDVLWQKAFPVMLVNELPRWPRFGATETKLRYDAPISVRNRDGTFATMNYSTAWNPELKDVVVSLPNGSRFVFWRGSSYIPFWAGRRNTGLSYEWAETKPPPDGFADCVEPLMDKELRYGRVEIVESTPARVHARWSYQSCDFNYKTWGDSASEDFYFYPDGFGTRVLTLQSAPGSNYELSEFIILTPQDAYPLDVLPANLVDILFLDGEKREITFPYDESKQGAKMQSRGLPAVYRVRLHKDDPTTAIYFHPQDRRLPPVVYAPFTDAGRVVTPCYWGSHWPLARGQATGGTINDRIHASPAHNSVMSWAMQRPPSLREANVNALDTLGHSKPMRIQTWVWLIGLTDAPDSRVLESAQSFVSPPSMEGLVGAHLETESFAPERRAVRLAAESPSISMILRPAGVCVNPVFEIRNAPSRLVHVNLDESPLPSQNYAWDGKTLWLNATMRKPKKLQLDLSN